MSLAPMFNSVSHYYNVPYPGIPPCHFVLAVSQLHPSLIAINTHRSINLKWHV